MKSILHEAMRRREASDLGATTAYRLLNGPGDEAPAGLTLDRYDRWLVLGARAHLPRSVVQMWAEVAMETTAAEGVALKILEPRAKDSRSECLLGSLPTGAIAVREAEATLRCRLDDGVQTGLFLDHRQTRLQCRTYADGVDVLNLFAYTCAFSVHAALAGARRVTSVDVSRRSLDWGRENMTASGVDPNRHRWFADDVIKHVGRGPDAEYGLVIVDPPVFGRAKGRTFSLSADLDMLLDGACRKVRGGGVLVFSTHSRAFDELTIERSCIRAAERVGRRARVMDRLGLPAADHPVVDDQPVDEAEDRGNYLKTLVLRIEGK